MKFAKELEHDLVPEWRAMYLDYKAGKKHVKRVARAIQRTNTTPQTPARSKALSTFGNYGTMSPATRLDSKSGKRVSKGSESGRTNTLGTIQEPLSEPADPTNDRNYHSPPMDIPRQYEEPTDGLYGSFVPTPSPTARPDFLQLPDPALSIKLDEEDEQSRRRPSVGRRSVSHSHIMSDSMTGPSEPLQRQTTQASQKPGFSSLRRFSFSRHNSTPGNAGGNTGDRSVFSRILNASPALTKTQTHRSSISLGAIDQVRSQQKEFFTWMDDELDKIETFYKSKEDQAGERLQLLREQLHTMRNRRLDELNQMRLGMKKSKMNQESVLNGMKNQQATSSTPLAQINSALQPLKEIIHDVRHKGTVGPNTKALQNMARSPEMLSQTSSGQQRLEGGRDYVRRPTEDQGVSYRSAKRKLKLAMQEYYRGLELLKSYALLNRTAFRKINKKYDKAVNARPPLRYMNQKVNKAWFVQSEIVDNYLHDVEDLYARYFEGGNHKVAVGKLRGSTKLHTDFSHCAFQNGLLIGIGGVFIIQGVIYASELLRHPDPTVQVQTSYLLQLYGGYFLGLYLFAWFCLDCRIWTRNKINYAFVFEFDRRHQLNWQELSQFPSLLLLILGLFVWINFSEYGTSSMFIYYPVLLIFVTILLIFAPAPIIYSHSRKWFAYSHWRLLLAGLYPVEFRDFFLGDMYCSLTYLTSNIELFFCLYATYWNRPDQCNSTHSRLLGFFACLPGIWRALQCLRRYWDTRNVFPHLVNCGKYTMTILYYVALSVYRIQKSNPNLAAFITFAAINAIYCSIWDLIMDWSLLQPHARRSLLRDVRGYKSTWWYYSAMILDPILRFNWIFYIIYTHDVQHSTIASFFIAFSEVTRRGIWTLFRVENEHCANVAHFKASRDVPLPYAVESVSSTPEQRASLEADATTTSADHSSPSMSRHRAASGAGTGPDVEAPMATTPGSLRRRPRRTLTMIFAEAHTQDFEKKRKPADSNEDAAKLERDASDEGKGSDGDDDDDDEEDARVEAMFEEEARAQAQAGASFANGIRESPRRPNPS